MPRRRKISKKNAKLEPGWSLAKLHDRDGKYLRINSGGRCWRINYRHGGKQKTLARRAHLTPPLKIACKKCGAGSFEPMPRVVGANRCEARHQDKRHYDGSNGSRLATTAAGLGEKAGLPLTCAAAGRSLISFQRAIAMRTAVPGYLAAVC